MAHYQLHKCSTLSAWLIATLLLLIDRCEAEEVDYLRDIKPILTKHCYACHGALKQESELRLDTAEFVRRGGSSGSLIVSTEDSDQTHARPVSELIVRVRASDDSLRMPPDAKPLSEQDISLLERWLSAGAPGPKDEQPQADPLKHWAFQPPKQNLPPAGSNASHPIDRFLDASSQRLKVVPLRPASRRELLRRLTLDLIGLPPTPQEIADFLADPSPTAYERVVERLLERPEYGQRWGRHWMDIWRYSDWYGRRSVPDVMNSYPQIWRWRDWIVRSLNEDKGYDRMIVEMLAADEVSPTDTENIVATGFIVRNWFKWNYETWMKDNVEHTGKAFLGLTLNCAQCHDHKFDPITQKDYFRFRAFFEPLELRHERVAGEPDPGPFKKYEYAKSYGPISSGAIRVFDEKLDARTFMFHDGDARNRIEGEPPVDPGPPLAFTSAGFQVSPIALPAPASYPGLKDFVRTDELRARQSEVDQADTTLKKAQQTLSSSEEKLAQLRLQSAQPLTAAALPESGALLAAEQERFDAELACRVADVAHRIAVAREAALKARIAADDAAYHAVGDARETAQVANLAEKQVSYESAQHSVLVAEQSLIQCERALAHSAADKLEAAKAAVAAATQKLQTARAAVDAARTQLATPEPTYAPLSPKYPGKSSGRRTALAKWIASDQNPLTARVAVNHIWLRHFGQPLVESVDNFGIQGKLPTHPELLDWLAVDFMSHAWSMKHLHRLIVTSAAYQRNSSTQVAEHPNEQLDRDNICYWRFPTRRMEAEVVRDSVIACAGSLDVSHGGREIDVADWIKTPRRSLYFTQHGEAQMLFLDTFDGANVCECYKRTSTVLPSQALAMSNSELLVHYGRVCAQRLTASTPLVNPNADENHTSATSKSPLEKAPIEHTAATVEAQRQEEIDTAYVQSAFETLLGRPASTKELAASLSFLDQQRQSLSAITASSDQPASAVGTAATAADNPIQPPASDVRQRARENLIIALFNHNDFVTIR